MSYSPNKETNTTLHSRNLKAMEAQHSLTQNGRARQQAIIDGDGNSYRMGVVMGADCRRSWRALESEVGSASMSTLSRRVPHRGMLGSWRRMSGVLRWDC